MPSVPNPSLDSDLYVLEILVAANRPVSFKELRKQVKGGMSDAWLYQTLKRLMDQGLVKKAKRGWYTATEEGVKRVSKTGSKSLFRRW